MRVFWSSTSPFVRKVTVFALETGLEPRIERIPVKTMPTTPDPELSACNPLSKMPSLETDDGEWLYDSRVACEYLDTLHDRAPLIPRDGAPRFEVLRLQAVGDGALDAGILCRYESLRPAAYQWSVWTDAQLGKVHRCLDLLERAAKGPSALTADALNVGQIAVGCMLGWLDFRMVAGDFRRGHPEVAAWYERFSERPSMRATVPYE
ncbi:glutathione S-transferase family protein [Pendulispora albinea]|uniref:Glutathione S-transferase N-terminal domain-containing protein n=1 Tax=Pendulispora albinea TaxID=2741071 RepID=A0ABZ2M7U1_9BACT